MKKSRKIAWFLSGAIVALLIAHGTPALAALAAKTIQVYPGVKVYVNDQYVDAKDANGNPVDVFIYNGTTYLPIRAIGNALGLPVQWDGKTSSAYIGSHKGDKPSMWLKDLDYFTSQRSGFKVLSDDKDNTGRTYQNSIVSYGNGSPASQTYKLNGQFSSLTGVFYQRYVYRSNTDKNTITIWADGEKIYSATVSAGVDPVAFNVDLTGVLEMKIVLEDNFWNKAAIGECGLWA